jgi:hypothetical protein
LAGGALTTFADNGHEADTQGRCQSLRGDRTSAVG